LQLAAKQQPLEVIDFKTCSPSEGFGNHSIILFGYLKLHGWIISVQKMVTEYHLFVNSFYWYLMVNYLKHLRQYQENQPRSLMHIARFQITVH